MEKVKIKNIIITKIGIMIIIKKIIKRITIEVIIINLIIINIIPVIMKVSIHSIKKENIKNLNQKEIEIIITVVAVITIMIINEDQKKNRTIIKISMIHIKMTNHIKINIIIEKGTIMT